MNRDARFDNIKALLIFLVVLGHSVEYLYGVKGSYGALRAVIYSFHMPAFVFISGYFASRSKSSLPDVTIKYFCTYLIFNTLFALTPWHVNSPLNFLYPQLIYWYLLCLCFWRISVETISHIKFALPLSLLLTLYIGTCPKADRFMSISRAICFFSFYLMGYKFSLKFIEKINKWLMGAALAACAGLTLIAYYKNLVPVKMYEYIQSYASTEVGNLQGIGMRVFMIATATIVTIGLIVIMPSEKNVFTCIGRNSLNIYLLHIFIIKAVAHIGIAIFNNEILNMIFSLVLTIAICMLLSMPVITDAYNYMISRIVRLFVVQDAKSKA